MLVLVYKIATWITVFRINENCNSVCSLASYAEGYADVPLACHASHTLLPNQHVCSGGVRDEPKEYLRWISSLQSSLEAFLVQTDCIHEREGEIK